LRHRARHRRGRPLRPAGAGVPAPGRHRGGGVSAKPSSSASRFARAAASRRTAEGQEPPQRGRTAPRTADYRTTVDLSPADHRRLRRISEDLAEELGRAEVPRRHIWLALLAELDTDPALRDRIRERLADHYAEE